MSDVVETSRDLLAEPVANRQVIRLSSAILAATDALRDFLFERVYDPINRQPATLHAQYVVKTLYEHFVADATLLSSAIAPPLVGDSTERHVADVISGMTDRYALRCHEALFAMRSEEF